MLLLYFAERADIGSHRFV